MKRPTHFWSHGQKDAFDRLVEIAEIFFNPDSESMVLGLRPRIDPLIIGPSGVGKSHLVRALGENLLMNTLRVSYGEWLIVASRSASALGTLLRIQKFVAENACGIIHIDELDKATTSLFSSEWSVYVRAEIFFLLDRTVTFPNADPQLNAALVEKLRTSFWIVGSGTWQDLWDQAPSIGFETVSVTAKLIDEMPERIRKANTIPAELLRRFCARLIVLPIPTADDYRHGAEIFGLNNLANKLGIALDFVQAEHGKLGARWLEEKYTELLLSARKVPHFKSSDSTDELFPEEQFYPRSTSI